MSNNSVATYSGRSIIWNRMKGNGTEWNNIGWGTSTTTASAISDVNLFAPATETRVAGTSTLTTTTQLGDTYKNTGTLTCLVGAKTITEAGLFDTTTLSPTTTLAVSITNAVTSISLGAASGIASNNYYRQMGNEVMLVTGGQNTVIETVTRGVLGSTSAAFAVSTATTVGGDGGAGTGGATSGQTATINAAKGGNMGAHADYAGISLSVNDSILYTWTDQLTALILFAFSAAMLGTFLGFVAGA